MPVRDWFSYEGRIYTNDIELDLENINGITFHDKSSGNCLEYYYKLEHPKIEDILEVHRKAYKACKIPMHLVDLEKLHESSMERVFAFRGKFIKEQLTKDNERHDPTYYKRLFNFVDDISKNKLRLGGNLINDYPYIHYKIDGTVTGRFTTSRDSFPILTLRKEDRVDILPRNDFFLEIDFNAADIRTYLGLSGKEQPRGDVHDWNIKNVFGKDMTRNQAKKGIMSWLYGTRAPYWQEAEYYPRDITNNFSGQGEEVVTPFGRRLKPSKGMRVSHLVQSTSSEIALRSAMNVHDLLKDKESFVSCTIHDSIIVDLSKNDIDIVADMIKTYKSTIFGDFPVNVSYGKNMFEMQKKGLK